jgi:hypothetical protein
LNREMSFRLVSLVRIVETMPLMLQIHIGEKPSFDKVGSRSPILNAEDDWIVRATRPTLGRCHVDKFLVQPATPVMSSPNLSVHKPAGNCASRYNDGPLMPSRCPCRVLVQFKYLDVDGCEARGCHRDFT